MASLNKVLLLGNLTRQPELRYTSGGMAVCEFGLAMNRRFSVNSQDREEVCFVDIVVWGKQAENCGKYLEKGAQIMLEGRLQLDQWQDKDTGAKRSKLRVVAETVQFLNKSDKAGAGADAYEPESYSEEPPQYQQSAPAQSQYQPPAQSQYQPPRQSAPAQSQYQPPAQSQYQPPQRKSVPPMPDNAFKVGDEAEDDIPF
jgi:single-strand DNA-binding protein